MKNQFFIWLVLMHILFIIGGYFVLQYSILLFLSDSINTHIVGYLFLLFFGAICCLIHYLVVDMYDVKNSPKKKWLFSVGGMCFSTTVAFLFLIFLF